MADKLLGALSLCKKAGALVAGFDAVCESAEKGEAALLLFAADLSPKTRKRACDAAKNLPYRDLPYTQDEMQPITKKRVGVLAVTSPDLAALCTKAFPNKEETV